MDDSKFENAVCTASKMLRMSNITEDGYKKLENALDDILAMLSQVIDNPGDLNELVGEIKSTFKENSGVICRNPSAEKLERCSDVLNELSACKSNNYQGATHKVVVPRDGNLPKQRIQSPSVEPKTVSGVVGKSSSISANARKITQNGVPWQSKTNIIIPVPAQGQIGTRNTPKSPVNVVAPLRNSAGNKGGERKPATEPDKVIKHNGFSQKKETDWKAHSQVLINVNKNTNVQEKAKQFTRTTTTTNAKWREISTLHTELNTQRTENRNLEQLLNNATKELESKDKDILTLRSDLASQRSLNEEKEQSLTKDSQKNFKAQERDVIEIHRGLKQREETANQSEVEDLQQIKDKLKEAENELENKNKLLAEKNEEINELAEKYKAVSKDLEQAKKNIEEATKIKELAKQVREAQAQNDRLESTITRLSQDLTEERTAKNNLEDEINELQEQIKSAKAAMGESESKIRKLNQELADCTKLLETAQAQNAELANQLSKSEQMHAVSSSEMSKIKSELAQYVKQLSEKEEVADLYYRKYCEEKSAKDDLGQKLKSFIDEHFRRETYEDICNNRVERYKAEAFSKLRGIERKIKGYSGDIQMFSGTSGSKTYLHIQEMIQRAIEETDKVQAEGHEDIRKKKKELISYCYQLDAELGAKVSKSW